MTEIIDLFMIFGCLLIVGVVVCVTVGMIGGRR